MKPSRDRVNELTRRIKQARKSDAPENTVGQWIAAFFEEGIVFALEEIVSQFTEYELGEPPSGKTWRLMNIYGEKRQIDHVISERVLGGKPIIIIEDKWLKDQRHLKDKGSWIMAMQGVQKANPSVRGIIALLAGEWNEQTLTAIGKVASVFHISTNIVYDNLRDIGINVEINIEREAFADPDGLLETILSTVENHLPEEDIIAITGKKIVKDIIPSLKETIKRILYPEGPETADKYELSITTSWGRILVTDGETTKKSPKEVMENIKQSIEKN